MRAYQLVSSFPSIVSSALKLESLTDSIQNAKPSISGSVDEFTEDFAEVTFEFLIRRPPITTPRTETAITKITIESSINEQAERLPGFFLFTEEILIVSCEWFC